MKFQKELERYAELLIVHGLNVQPQQVVNIGTEVIHRDLAMLLAQKAYERGAKFVNIDFMDPRLGKIRLEKSTSENLEYFPRHNQIKYNDLVDECSANLALIGSEYPDIYEGIDPKKINSMQSSRRKALKYFYDEGIGKSKVHWNVAAAATPAWGKKIFPNLSPEQACDKLWEAIFKTCRADKEDCLTLWKEHNETLAKRAKHLTDLKIREFHFIGPGTDLVVELSPKAKFKGGTDISTRGVPYEPNIPTEECFTTPDYRRTRGRVRATRPFEIHGTLIRDLEVEFKDGEISDFTASSGADTFKEYINTDPGAKRLGEVALVGIDSPIYQTGIVFEEILFDENAACHIAVGSAYKFCIEGGDNMSKEELEAIGCNDSHVHTDMMISSENVDVYATTYDGKKITLIKNGHWA